METVVKVGRAVSGGFCRAAGTIYRGTRRLFAAIPLLGIYADDPTDEISSTEKEIMTGGEDAENATAAVNGTEEQSAPTSPTESSSTPVVDAKEDEKPAPPSSATTEASPVADKDEATVAAPSSPIAPNPVPVEAKNDEAEKEEVANKIVESVTELAAPMENNGLAETIEEAAKNVIAEVPTSPLSKAPMITEDVASVTKAVEEIDINEKAVAAAVNENIECTKNEIIAEMNHVNNLNE